MALLAIDMAKLEEIFLPFMVTNTGKTFFEAVEQRNFQLPSGQQHDEPLEGDVVA